MLDSLGSRQRQGGQRALRSAICRSRGATFTPLVREITNDTFSVVDNVGGELLVATEHGRRTGESCAIDPAKPAEANWKTVLPERPEPLDRRAARRAAS